MSMNMEKLKGILSSGESKVENGRFNRAKPVFDCIIYPSLVDAVEYDGDATNWLNSCRMDAERIRNGGLDDCEEFKKAMDIMQQLKEKKDKACTLQEEVQKIDDYEDEMEEKVPFYRQLIRRYKESNFSINLRPHEALHGKHKDDIWSVQLCPQEACKGFVQFKNDVDGSCCACNSLICRKCRKVINTQGDESHTCLKEDVESVKQMLSDSKPCPACFAPIYRSSGCTHMHCSKCHHDFDWASMKTLTRRQTTNPMAEEYYDDVDDEQVDDLSKGDLIPSIPELIAKHVSDTNAMQIVRDVVSIARQIYYNKRNHMTQYYIPSMYNTGNTKHHLFVLLCAIENSGSSTIIYNAYKVSTLLDTFVILVSYMYYAILEMQYDLVSNGTSKADEERYKYVSGIIDEDKYKRFLFREKKRYEKLAEQDIPRMCEKIQDGALILKPLFHALDASLQGKSPDEYYATLHEDIKNQQGVNSPDFKSQTDDVQEYFVQWGIEIFADVKIMACGKFRQTLKNCPWVCGKIRSMFGVNL